MPETPKKPYIVALQFGLPPKQIIHINGVVAISPEMAIAVTTSMTIQELHVTESLTGFAMQELTEDFLVAALNAVRGRPIEGEGAVVSLVKPLPIQPGDDGAILPPSKEVEIKPHAFCSDYSKSTGDICVCGETAGHPIHTGAA